MLRRMGPSVSGNPAELTGHTKDPGAAPWAKMALTEAQPSLHLFNYHPAARQSTSSISSTILISEPSM